MIELFGHFQHVCSLWQKNVIRLRWFGFCVCLKVLLNLLQFKILSVGKFRTDESGVYVSLGGFFFLHAVENSVFPSARK
jgi:hypothetical protein